MFLQGSKYVKLKQNKQTVIRLLTGIQELSDETRFEFHPSKACSIETSSHRLFAIWQVLCLHCKYVILKQSHSTLIQGIQTSVSFQNAESVRNIRSHSNNCHRDNFNIIIFDTNSHTFYCISRFHCLSFTELKQYYLY